MIVLCSENKGADVTAQLIRVLFLHMKKNRFSQDVAHLSLQQPIPLTPEIQIVKRQPVPRLTSTPTRKTSTPNNDGYQLAQFEV